MEQGKPLKPRICAHHRKECRVDAVPVVLAQQREGGQQRAVEEEVEEEPAASRSRPLLSQDLVDDEAGHEVLGAAADDDV